MTKLCAQENASIQRCRKDYLKMKHISENTLEARYSSMEKNSDEPNRPIIEVEFAQSRLFSAVVYHKLTTVIDLLNNNYDINKQDCCGSTPLMYAVIHKDAPILKTLLEKGADVSLKNNEGNNAFHILASHGGHPDMVDDLAQYGTDINDKNDMGYTPLMLAIHPDNTSLMAKLIVNGAKIPTSDDIASVYYPEYLTFERIDFLLQKAIEKAKNGDFSIKPVKVHQSRNARLLAKRELAQKQKG